MPTRVKICGLKTAGTVSAALDSGADYVGFVFYPRSPRSVALADAASLRGAAIGRAAAVALVVDADDARIGEIAAAVRPDMFQLHGSETPERTRQIKAMTRLPVMKAISVATAADALRALDYADAADLILFDAKPAPGDTSALPGGNGIPFDWRAINEVADRVPFILSGGLTCDNVAEAIRLTKAKAVDVSSGVESAPGVKDAELIRRFIRAAKGVG
ncbi:MAG: phosphoribosylanthranilate isomerase [Hyphomicrobiaceae bacterium]|nr:MAG: phosphoribosylanthranilate isomerase [Hyphomicrobiaceae bacterium]